MALNLTGRMALGGGKAGPPVTSSHVHMLPPPLYQLLSPVPGVGRQELLHQVAGEGLAVDYAFSRQPFSRDPHMVSVHIYFSNSSETPIKGLHVGTSKLPAGISIQEFPEIGTEGPWMG